MTPTHYRSSDGRVIPLADMHDSHLENAIAKMERPGGLTNAAMLKALQDERTRRGAQ